MSRHKEGFSVYRRGSGDGGWILSYQAEPGVWKQKRLGYHSDEVSATRVARAWLATRIAEGSLPSATRTVQDIGEEWLRLRAANPKVAGATVADNRDQLKTHVYPTLGSTPIGRLDLKQLRDWVREIRDKVGAFRCHNIVNTLSALYEDARAEGWVKAHENIVRHPAVRRELPEAKAAREEIVTLSLEAAQRLIGDERIDGQRRLRYALAFTSGLRDGEIAGLTWGDVVLDARPPVLRVRRAHALRSIPGQHASASDPKTRESRRLLPLHPAVVDGLAWWRAEGWEAWAAAPWSETQPLFPSPKTGKAWRPKSAELIRQDLETLGLPSSTLEENPIDFHATRRSFDTWLAEAGIDTTTKERLMGHAGKTTAEKHYTGILLGRLAAAVGTIPLRWGVAELSEISNVRGPFDPEPHSAHQVHPHKETHETAAGRLSSVVEQRFRNSLRDLANLAESGESEATPGTVGDEANDRHASEQIGRERLVAFGASRLYGVTAAKRRALEDQAAAAIETLVDLVVDGRSSLDVGERRRQTETLLAKAADLLDRRDRKAV